MNEDDNDDMNYDFDTSSYAKEEEIGKGGMVPPGFYHAVVEKIEKDHTGQNPALKFTFCILAGPQKRQKVFERLFLTEKNNGRVVLFGNRLGLIGKGELGKESVRKSWNDAKDRQVILELIERDYTAKDGSTKKATNVKYDGIYKLDDPRVAAVPREGSATKAVPTTAAGSATQAAFDDL